MTSRVIITRYELLMTNYLQGGRALIYFTQAISEFLSRRFPKWGDCKFRFDPQTNTIYVKCQNYCRRAVIIEDAQAIAELDIGVEKFVVLHPDYPDVIIQRTPGELL
ncbi:MAG: hypothetical protein VKL59_03880 [Nostocaceae cyanobacterium]|nr:hypothetical protein [Nostocaceae cyanobacterium]